MNIETTAIDSRHEKTLLNLLATLAVALLVYGMSAPVGNTARAMTGFGPVDPFATSKPRATPVAPVAYEPQALQSQATGTLKAFLVHKEPQDLPAFGYLDEAGNRHTLEELRGKLVLLNLWATWCAPCRHEMPALDELKRKFADKPFEMLTISIDRGGLTKPRRFFDDIGVKDLVLYGAEDSKLSPQLKAFGMPTTLLIDPEGREIGRLTGPAEWVSDEALGFLETAMKTVNLSDRS